MSKIVKLELNNFRNIKHIELDFKTNPVVISGNNNLGKSNILSALSWFFTNSLLTDKWGTGENDIDSIIPIDQVKGEYVSVKVTFDSGVEFTKNYKTLWDTKTGKPKGHTAEGYINSSVSKNMTLWNAELMKEVNFQQSLFTFNELRLFTDPLYALQKLEPKDLRKLLIELGCEVSNEEVFKALESEYDLSIVKENESKYRGNFYDMRLDYKKTLKADNESLVLYENQLKMFNEVEEYDADRLKALEEEINSLNAEYYSIKDEATSGMLLDIENQIKEKTSAKTIKAAEFESNKKLKLAELDSKINEQNKLMENARTDRNKDLIQEVNRLEVERESIRKQVSAYQVSLTNIVNSLTASSKAGKRLIEDQAFALQKLNSTNMSTFNDMVTCPVCTHQFAVDPVAQKNFEIQKSNEITRLNGLLEKYKVEIKSQKESFIQLKKQREETANEISKLEDKNQKLATKISELETQIKANNDIPFDTSELAKLTLEKQNLAESSVDLSLYDTQIQALKEKKFDLENKSSLVINSKRAEVSSKLNTLKGERDEIYIQKSKWETKTELTNKREEALEALNNHESELEVINAVIHKTIEMCNQKAYEKTGFKFVMLEETLSETIKEVCYLVVDGVPFANVNTSRKAIIGTQFINRIKDILYERGIAKNDFPVLFDKLESISLKTLETNKDLLTECQFICTKVTEEEVITC